MQLLDGKKLADKLFYELKTEVSLLGRLRLGVVKVGDNPAVNQFIAIKKKKAEALGIDVRIYPFEDSIATTTNVLRDALSEIVHEEHNTGVIVQLPLPAHINEQTILNAVTPEKDVDVLSARAIGDFVVRKSVVMPPVVGAIAALVREYNINIIDKYVVVVGAGTLVGRPVISWLMQEKATFSQVIRTTVNPDRFFKEADVIISGVGKQNLIRGEMIKEGVIVFDAGTSVSKDTIKGDVDFESVSKKASFITPIPGGIGPLTVAMLLKNLVTFAKN